MGEEGRKGNAMTTKFQSLACWFVGVFFFFGAFSSISLGATQLEIEGDEGEVVPPTGDVNPPFSPDLEAEEKEAPTPTPRRRAGRRASFTRVESASWHFWAQLQCAYAFGGQAYNRDASRGEADQWIHLQGIIGAAYRSRSSGLGFVGGLSIGGGIPVVDSVFRTWGFQDGYLVVGPIAGLEYLAWGVWTTRILVEVDWGLGIPNYRVSGFGGGPTLQTGVILGPIGFGIAFKNLWFVGANQDRPEGNKNSAVEAAPGTLTFGGLYLEVDI